MCERAVLTDEMSEYLTALQEAGVVTLPDVLPYLQQKFFMSKADAETVFLDWTVFGVFND